MESANKTNSNVKVKQWKNFPKALLIVESLAWANREFSIQPSSHDKEFVMQIECIRFYISSFSVAAP